MDIYASFERLVVLPCLYVIYTERFLISHFHEKYRRTH